VAIALNWEDFLRFGSELPVDGRTTVIYDAATNVAEDKVPLGVRPLEAIAVPIGQMARDTAGTELAKNTVVLGLLADRYGSTVALLGLLVQPLGLLAALARRTQTKAL
jgi:2-oxoglutarate ferredoxin oxidoreductase subunit alpha